VVLPGLTFLLIYCWPWIDRRITGDRSEHHVLSWIREVPLRVAVGAAALTFYGLLLAAGADDLAARIWRVPVRTIVGVLRVLVLVLPVAVGLVAWLVARRLRRSGVDHQLRAEPFDKLRTGSVEAPLTRAEPVEAPPHLKITPEDAPEPVSRGSRS
jgi:ubiquinol-cytochrome c reductase cytochrome b subunit